MNKKDLIEGVEFEFDNERFCEETFSDDLRCGSVGFNERLGLFNIFFNGVCVHTSKTFKSCKNKLDKLFNEFNLSFIKEI